MRRLTRAALAFLFFFPAMSLSAAAAPASLGAITEGLKSPMRVAVDGQGRVYVTETTKDRVRIYDRSGKLQATIPGVFRPLGIAVASDGKVYVGSERDDRKGGSVEVFNADLIRAAALASDVSQPNAIAINAAGTIYVADSRKNVVRVFDGSGDMTKTLGAAGQFTKPTALAVDNKTGRVYVADLPLVADSSGANMINGVRIQAFDQAGAFLFSFGQFGMNAGQIGTPTALAVDAAGTLYVADRRQNAVQAFDIVTDASGQTTGIWNANRAMAATYPMGVAVSANGVAYVACDIGSVAVFGLDGYVTMTANPALLSFIGRQLSAPALAPQAITVANNGSGVLNWTATASANWITLGAAASGQTTGGSSSSIAVGADISNLAPGTYTGAVTVQALDFNQSNVVNVSLTVAQAPIVSAGTGLLTFSAKKGQSAPSQTLTVSVSDGPANWSMTSDSDWLKAQVPATPGASATVTVSVDTTGLAPKTYTGHLTLQAPGMIGDGGTVTVNLTIGATNKLSVATNRPDASFSVTGPASYRGSGLAWSVEDAPAGPYTVSFDAVVGFRAPGAQTKAVAAEGETAFTGSYAALSNLAAKMTILASRGASAKSDTTVKAYANDGTAVAGFDFAALDGMNYGVNAAVGDVDGDGLADIIVGVGAGPNNPALVRIYKADRTVLTADFIPFGTLYGANVAAGDLDGDGKDEVVVAPAGGPENAARVVVYTFDAASRKMVPTGVDFTAHGFMYGARVAVVDTEGDGRPELVTAAGPGKQNPGQVRVWKVNTETAGSWSVSSPALDMTLPAGFGATVAGGNTDDDAAEEIIVGAAPADGDKDAVVHVLKADGSEAASFAVFERRAVNVAAADLDGDGKAEVIAAVGAFAGEAGLAEDGRAKNDQGGRDRKRKNGKEKEKESEHEAATSESGLVKVFSGAGSLRFAVTAFEDAKGGVTAAVGELGL